MSSISSFLSHFASKNDFSKSSRFDVDVYLPQSLNGVWNGNEVTRSLKMQCEMSQLPGYNINTVDGRTYGETYPTAATSSYNDISLSFICSGDLWEKRFFDDWMASIIPKNNYLVSYRDTYVSTISVNAYYDFYDEARISTAAYETTGIFGIRTTRTATFVDYVPKQSYQVMFEEIFPASMDPIQLSWAEESINKLTVNFKYSRWVNTDNDSVLVPGKKRGLYPL